MSIERYWRCERATRSNNNTGGHKGRPRVHTLAGAVLTVVVDQLHHRSERAGSADKPITGIIGLLPANVAVLNARLGRTDDAISEFESILSTLEQESNPNLH